MSINQHQMVEKSVFAKLFAFMLQEFGVLLGPITDKRGSMEIIFSVGKHYWIVPVEDMRLDHVMF